MMLDWLDWPSLESGVPISIIEDDESETEQT